jgi:hypothetical protein
MVIILNTTYRDMFLHCLLSCTRTNAFTENNIYSKKRVKNEMNEKRQLKEADTSLILCYGLPLGFGDWWGY